MVIITDNNAIISLQATGHLDDILALGLKKEVYSAAKKADSQIKNVTVTLSAEMSKCITKLTAPKKLMILNPITIVLLKIL